MAQPTVTTQCEYQANPFIQTQNPRFTWALQGVGFQTGFTFMLGTDKQLENPLYTTTSTDTRAFFRYEGPALESTTVYYYRIFVATDTYGTLMGEGSFETAYLNQEDWQGEWIGSPLYVKRHSPLFRQDFQATGVASARMFISGLGYYELTINGVRVGDRVMDPGWTDYTFRVLYSAYDVTELLQEGGNALGIMLGEGWHGHEHPFFQRIFGTNPRWFADCKLRFDLVLTLRNGEKQVISSKPGGMLCQNGPIVMNNVYDGETYDARQELPGWNLFGYAAEGWQPAVAAPAPGGFMQLQSQPPIRKLKRVKPVDAKLADDRKALFDMGENFSGWVQIRVKGFAPDKKVTLRFSETLKPGTQQINQSNLRDAKCTDVYYLKGDGSMEVYEPRFTYHGFRYVEISYDDHVQLHGMAGYRVNTDLQPQCTVETGLPMLNKIFKAVLLTELNNVHSVPTDCPQRDERLGWVNDVTVRHEEAMFHFDAQLFYEKWHNDLCDVQKINNNGCIGDTAPFFYGGLPGVHPTDAFLLVPWNLYLLYGDDTLLREHYPQMAAYLNFKATQMVDDKGLIHDDYCGDWAPPITETILGFYGDAIAANIDNQLLTTGYWYYDCRLMEKMARHLGKAEDASQYAQMAERVKVSFNKAFFCPEQGCYLPRSQGSQLWPLFLDLVPEGYQQQVESTFIKLLTEDDNCHVTTGNQLTKYLFEVLNKLGRNDLAVAILQKEDYPSFGYMFKNGGTSIWERWEASEYEWMNSYNHPMHGSFSVWYHKALSGLRVQEQGLTGRILIKPDFLAEVGFVKGEFKTRTGTLRSSWKREGKQVNLAVELPWNTAADLELPVATATINGKKTALTANRLTLAPGKYEIAFAL